jgi:glycosyltransferase involved in cell wall biosynthesis
MKKILAISWAFPPIILPRSLQVSRTLKSLQEHGWQFTILTVDPRSIRRTFKSDSALGAEFEGVFETVSVPSPEDFLVIRGIWRLFPDLSLIPDPRSVWIPAVQRAGRRILQAENFDGIISFAQPWSDHIAARKLKQEFNLPWIAHFSDPWVDSPYYQPKGFIANIRKNMEKMVIQDADAVIFVSDETRNLVMKKYPAEWKQKAHVIPHCYDSAQFQNPADSISQALPLRIVYTGGFYGHRTPVNLFKALAKINQNTPLEGLLELQIVGPGMEPHKDLIPAMNLEKVVTTSPIVPYQESWQIASRADVLLVIDAASKDVNVFLPSKLIEYLAFRKPVFGITPLKGETADLLRSLSCPLTDTEDIDGISSSILELIHQKQIGGLTVSSNFETIASKYDIRQTTRQYLDLLEMLCGK